MGDRDGDSVLLDPALPRADDLTTDDDDGKEHAIASWGDLARVFGGDTWTASDIAVAAGYARMGDAGRVADLDPARLRSAVAEIHRLFADAIDRMKVSAEAVPLVLVGGGSVLIHEEIPGVSDVIIPQGSSVANAIGASIAQASGEIDRVFSYEQSGRETALESATAQARQAAIDGGAAASSLSVVEVEELPLAYVPGGAVRVRVKVVGNLDLPTPLHTHEQVSRP